MQETKMITKKIIENIIEKKATKSIKTEADTHHFCVKSTTRSQRVSLLYLDSRLNSIQFHSYSIILYIKLFVTAYL